MTKLYSDEKNREFILSEARTHGLPEAAARLGVNHVTLWEFVKKWEPTMVTSRRPKVSFDNIPNEVCLAIYRAHALEGKDISLLQETHGLSRKNIVLAIRKGRGLHKD